MLGALAAPSTGPARERGTRMSEAPGPLAGLRVVEIAAGTAVAYCGQLLAQAGADIVRVEPPEGDEIRLQGPFPGDRFSLDEGGMHRVLNGGKRSVAAAASAEGAAAVEALVADCDLLLSSHQADSPLPLDDPAEFARRFPGVTYASISPFGATGPYASYRADSQVIEALSGFSYVTGNPDREPLAMGVDIADYFAGVNGYIAALAALFDGGRGFVDVSSLESLALADDHTLAVYAGTGAIRRRYYSRVLIAYPMDVLPCKDGAVAFIMQANSAPPLAELIGRPELAEAPILAEMRERVLNWQDFDALILPWLAKHSADEVVERARELRLPFGYVLRATELLEDEHLNVRGFFDPPPGGERTLGPPFRLTETPLRSGTPPALGEHDAQPWPAPREAGEGVRGHRGALDGLKVIDLSRVWAGPHIGRSLADLGADVVKVERPHLPGTLRSGFIAGNDSNGAYWNRSTYFLARNAGKRALTLDYATEEGQEVLHRLLAEADVLIENFTPPVLRRYALDYASLKERHPHLVMVSVCGYGQTGPNSDNPALGQTIEPAAGISAVTGYEGEPPILAGNTLGDAFSGMHAVAGVLTALLARERSGRGQHVDVAMQEAMIQLSGAHVMDALLNGRVHAPAGNRRPGMVRGAYRCEGDDAFVAISARGDGEWAALCEAIGRPELARVDRFRDDAARAASHDAIDAILGEWAIGRTNVEAMATLQAAGVPAGAALRPDEVFTNEQLLARRFFEPVELPEFGEIPLQRYIPALFDGAPYPPPGRAPIVDEHTEAVLSEAGLSAEERQRLFDAGITAPDLSVLQSDVMRSTRVMDLEAYVEQGSVLRIDEDYRERLAAALRASS